jgi:polyphosphate kinase
LDLDNDINSSLVEKLEKSLKKRKKGQPVRLVYDRNIKEDILSLLIQKLKLSGEDNIIPGGKYHNFKDFINFPVKGFEHLRYEPMPPLPHPFLENQRSIFDVVKKKDIMLFYPYQKFDYIIDLLREAAIDPDVVSIKITLYRLAKPSAIINALINAARNGKQVTVLVEIQARFDEEANIEWANLLQEEGVKVIFGVEGLKVHSKIFLITRKNGRKKEQLVHIGTGNFNENTAKLYSDISLITCRKGIVDEIEKVFEMFQSPFKQRKFKHLLVSPLFMRQQLIEKIKHQIKLAKKGHRAYIGIKVNNLSDEEIIKYLYEASQAGVEIQLIVRSICSLIPQKKNLSENIQAKSIVDRFLEHARIFIFGAQEPEIYISSADLMLRNLDYRIEVATPVYDKKLKELLLKFFEIQWQDNQKARIIDEKFTNTILKDDQSPIRSQYYLYEFFNNFLYNNRTLKNLSLQKN